MTMIKLGNRYFNLANVTVITDRRADLAIAFSAESGGEVYELVRGAEADALRRYLQRTAVDLLGPAENDRDYQTYRERGGELGYDAWRDEHARLSSFHSKSETWWESPSNQKLVAQLEAELKL